MNKLLDMKCIPCEGGVAPLNKVQVDQFLKQIDPAWQVDDAYTTITRRFEFKGYYKTIAFVNAIAWIANQENHHPDLQVGFNHCTVSYSTHAIRGLSENDFICAAKIDAL